MKLFRSRSSRVTNGGLATVSTSRTGGQLTMLHLADNTRNNLVAVIGEFVGTFLFLFWSFAGTQISNTPKPAPGSFPNTSNLLFAALAFGFSLTVNVWAFYRITGGLFNPSVGDSIISLIRHRLTFVGNTCLIPCWWAACYTKCSGIPFSDSRWYLRSGSSIVPLPRSSQRRNHPWRRNIYFSRTLY
jgi:hypothetical protein